MRKLVLPMALVLLALVLPSCAMASSPSIYIQDVTVSPGALMSGDSGEITVTISNGLRSTVTGTSQVPATAGSTDDAVDLSEVILESSGPVRVTSGSYKDIGSMSMIGTARFTFLITVDDDADDGIYFLILKIITTDEEIYLNYPVNVLVDNSPVKIMLNEAPGSSTTGEDKMTFDVVNSRPDDINEVCVQPMADGYSFKPAEEYVIGTMGPHQIYTLQFDILGRNPNSTEPRFKVVYKNGNNPHESAPTTVRSLAIDPTVDKSSGSIYLYLAAIGIATAVIGGVAGFWLGKRG